MYLYYWYVLEYNCDQHTLSLYTNPFFNSKKTIINNNDCHMGPGICCKKIKNQNLLITFLYVLIKVKFIDCLFVM